MKKVLNIIVDVVIWVFVAFAALMTFLVFTSSQNKEGVPSIGGKMLFTVQTESMKPTINVGDMVKVEKVLDPNSTLKVDDIITFYMDDGSGNIIINTHRIVKVNDQGDGYCTFTTKGDNNSENDTSDVKTKDIIGKYSGKIPKVGKVVDFLKTKLGFFVCILLPLIAFFLYELIRFIMVVIEGRRDTAISAEDEEEIKKKAIEEYLAKQAMAQNNENAVTESEETKATESESSEDVKQDETQE